MRFYYMFVFLAAVMAAPNTGSNTLREPPTPRQAAAQACCSSVFNDCVCIQIVHVSAVTNPFSSALVPR